MHLADRLLSFTLLGSEWVLWLLLALSVGSVTVMIERALALSAKLPNFNDVTAKLVALLSAHDVAAARAALGDAHSPESRVALAGLDAFARGRTATLEAMASAKSQEKLALEKNLGVLGTLGSNAPFIGLFGTVLGIIKAFADLAKNRSGGAEAVMSGISEALVATAVGLVVAIPAVIAYNALMGKVRRVLGRIDAMAHAILAARGDFEAPASAPVSLSPKLDV